MGFWKEVFGRKRKDSSESELPEEQTLPPISDEEHASAIRAGQKKIQLPPNQEVAYEIGELVGAGNYSAYFRIKKHGRLGVKIQYRRDRSKHKNALEQEWRKSKVLTKMNVPVPKYVGIIKIKIPDKMPHIIQKAISKQVLSNPKELSKLLQPGEIYYGLVIEHIESDLRMIPHRKLWAMYALAKKRIEALGIKVYDSGSEHNILYSKKKRKMYFIDYEAWVFPARFGNFDEIQPYVEVASI